MTLHTGGLCKQWAGQHAWRILDTDWLDGAQFLACWNAWKRDPQRPHMLHYVGLIEPGCVTAPAPSLAAKCQLLEPGFNRFSFSGGQVLLTLCCGERKSMLRAQRFAADSIGLNAAHNPVWDDWTIQALLRCCQRGTRLIANHANGDLVQRLTKNGFEIQGGDTADDLQAHFNPSWQIKSTRKQPVSSIQHPSHCVVIGAGLAGASTAASLARRGWQVQVLDAAVSPASAASGLPVGLMVPPLQSDHNARSHLLRAGVKLTIEQARDMLTSGQDWAQSGVMSAKPGQAAYWEPAAAWVKPQRLVQAWLAQPNIEFRGNACVVSMEQAGGEWILRDAQNAVMARANLVVLACADGVQRLATRLNVKLRQSMAGVHGQVSWAAHQGSDRDDLPAFPVNGLGHLLPDIPLESGSAWFAGATYSVADHKAVPSVSSGHASNLSKLAKLHSPSGDLMHRRIQEGRIEAWRGSRFTTPDRMPMVGPLAPLLYINSGFGSRGLSWAVLCAELLAGQIGNEPLAMPNAWARLLRASL